MRKINHIVVHCTATPDTVKVQSILDFWRVIWKWKNPGYHYLVDRFGEVHAIHPETEVSNGVRGHNSDSIHVSYIGGQTVRGEFLDTRTLEQKKAIFNLLYMLKTRYPEAEILGHRDFKGVTKTCPLFDAKEEYKNLNEWNTSK